MVAEASSVTYQDIARHIRKHIGLPSGGGYADLKQLLQAFVDENESPASSPNYKTTCIDNADPIVTLLQQPNFGKDPALVLLALTVLKILSRKGENRTAVKSSAVAVVLRTLASPSTVRIAAEAANVILNFCYEEANVKEVLKHNGVASLLPLLSGESTAEVQANAAGAVQSICYQKAGRAAVREAGGVPAVISLLGSDHAKVQTRAMGALHNISSDPHAIRLIRRGNGIPKIVKLLKSDNIVVAASAAGTLQNVAREVASRMIICDMDCTDDLVSLLASGDTQAAVCAAGALLNILGPSVTKSPDGEGSRQGMCRIMRMAIALASVYEGCFDSRPELGVA